MDDDDWDLHAVVRGCAASTAATDYPTFPNYPKAGQNQYVNDPFQGLHPLHSSITAAADIAGATSMVSLPAAHNVFQPRCQENVQILKPPVQMNNVQSQENIQFNNPRPGSSFSSSHNYPQPNKQRRRKNQQLKIVRQMTQEELSADSWAWRKYGQKPIKGSPYPRNYYRCSTSKGCAARKQVERSPTDPCLFVVSYTGEHTHPRPTHRSSLAGSTRTKLSSPRTTTTKTNNNNNNNNMNMISSSSSLTGLSAENNDVEMAEEEECGGDEDDENIFIIQNDDDEDVFKGFQDYDHDHSSGAGDLFPCGSPPWTPTGSAATFGGGG